MNSSSNGVLVVVVVVVGLLVAAVACVAQRASLGGAQRRSLVVVVAVLGITAEVGVNVVVGVANVGVANVGVDEDKVGGGKDVKEVEVDGEKGCRVSSPAWSFPILRFRTGLRPLCSSSSPIAYSSSSSSSSVFTIQRTKRKVALTVIDGWDG